MFACRRARGLIATALYEKLADTEQGFLDNHLAQCSACRAEKLALASVVETIPQESAVLDFDLLPALRRRLMEPERPRFGYAPRFALAGAVCTALLVGSVWLHSTPKQSTPQAPVSVAANETVSPVGAALKEADALMAERHPKEAFLALKKATDTYPEAPETPQAMIQLADLSFDELHWYKESYSIHKLLLSKYLADVKNRPEADKLQERLNELAEASKDDYEPLFRLDEARADRSGAFAKLETLVAQYHGKYVAHDAVMTMAKMVAAESPASGILTKAAALEEIRGRCTKPLAKNQLAWELAEVYGNTGSDPSKAIVLYTEVAKGPDSHLAQLAKAALAQRGGAPQTPK